VLLGAIVEAVAEKPYEAYLPSARSSRASWKER
jgi:hypothetical protein